MEGRRRYTRTAWIHQIVTHGFTQRPTPHQLHVAFGHLQYTGEIFNLFTPKTDKIRL